LATSTGCAGYDVVSQPRRAVQLTAEYI